VTVNKKVKRTPSAPSTPITDGTDPSSIAPETHAEKPAVTILTSPNFDALSQKLERIGLLVKRQQTNTISQTVTVPATTTVISTILQTVSTISIATAYFTTSNDKIKSTSTSKSTSSTTSGSISNGVEIFPTSSNQSTRPNSSSIGLSIGARAGIGIGTAAGSSTICVIILFWWRRRHPKKDDGAAAAASAVTQPSPVFPGGYSGTLSGEHSSLPGQQANSPTEFYGNYTTPYQMPPQEGYRPRYELPMTSYGHEMHSDSYRQEMPST
jgi:hypothetical protein